MEGDKMKVRKAVIPAAGLGTRFLPITKTVPKEMLPLLDRPVIQEVIEESVLSGITDIILVTGMGKSSIEDYFDISLQLERFLAEKGKRGFSDGGHCFHPPERAKRSGPRCAVFQEPGWG